MLETRGSDEIFTCVSCETATGSRPLFRGH